MACLTGYMKIDKDWKFMLGDVAGAESVQSDDSAWRRLDLPHDWSIEGEFSEKNFQEGYFEDGRQRSPGDTASSPRWIPRSDSYLPKGTGWYRKKLNAPARSEGQRVYLYFEGIFRDSVLWVNGKKAGSHRSGYTGAVYDITPHLNGNREGNIIAVYVDARKTEGWWYEGSGIYRHAWCIVKPALHVEPWKIKITTPHVSYTSAAVNVRTQVANKSAGPACCTLRTSIMDPGGRVVSVLEAAANILQGQNGEFIQEAVIDEPALWAPEHPALYTARTEVVSAGGEIDSQETQFGIRWFEFTPDRGFFLNGRKVQLRGGCIHHDFGGLGAALPDRAHVKNVEVLKEMGANLIRLSHNPAAPALLDACDRLGMLVWAETRNLDVDNGAKEDLMDLVNRDFNHPSIILWSLANTAGDRGGEKSTGFLKALHALAHQLDPARPTAVALEGNADPNANGFAMVTDVVGYNGGGMSIDDRDHEIFPQRKIMISEYSSGRGARGFYRERPAGESSREELEEFGDGRILKRAGHYCSVYDLCSSHEKGTLHFAEGWDHINARPWMAGGCMWSAIEYRGETTGWPVVTSQFGVLDLCRFPKDAYYYYRSIWTKTPVFHIFPHWTWPGREGQPIDIWCYRNCCDIVDLFVNGRKINQEPDYIQYKTNRPHLVWASIPYEPGVLTAVGRMKDGKIVCRLEIKTAGAPGHLRLCPDRQNLSADGEDISFIKLSAHDAEETFVPCANNEVTVEVDCGGKLLGLCSGDPASHESEKANKIRLFNGLALAVVQNCGKEADLKVRVSSPGLKAAETVISVRK